MRSSTYIKNRKLAQFKDTTPTMTDQAGARDTDINIIVGKMRVTGTVPGNSKTAIDNADFSSLPTDLRSMIEKSRELEKLRDNLPAEFRHMSTSELVAADPKHLAELTNNAATIKTRREKLPQQFRRISDQDILALTDAEFTSIITPAHTNTNVPENK